MTFATGAGAAVPDDALLAAACKVAHDREGFNC